MVNKPIKILLPGEEFIEREKGKRHAEKVFSTLNATLPSIPEDDRARSVTKLRKSILNGPAPSNYRELYDCIVALTGFRLAYTTCDPEHTSPFEALARSFFEEWSSALWYANRSGGKTNLISLDHFLSNTFKPGYTSLHAAGVKTQAIVVSEYLQNYARDPALSSVFKTQPTTYSAHWKNGSFWKITAGQSKSIDGQHPVKLSLDEIKYWEIADIDTTWAIPVNRDGYKKMHNFASTNQFAGMGMNYIIDNADKKGIKVAKWNIVDTMVPCHTCAATDAHPYANGAEGDLARESVCVLWKYCRGERAKKVTGFRSREDVCTQIQTWGGIDDEKTQTQGLCMKPSTKGLVLFNFEHEYQALKGNYADLYYTEELDWYAAYDPSEGSKSVLLFIHVYTSEKLGKIAWVFDELIQEDCPDATAAKEAFYIRCKERGYKDPVAVIVDPRKTDAIYQWRAGTQHGEAKNHKYNALAPDITQVSGGHEIAAGIDEMRRLIGQRRLLVNPDMCKGLIQAIKNHMYVTDKDGEVAPSSKPKEAFKDEIDAWRYFTRYFVTKLWGGGGGGIKLV